MLQLRRNKLSSIMTGLALFVVTAQASYIENAKDFSILPQYNGTHYYQRLALAMRDTKIYTQDELKAAMTNGSGQLHSIFHTLAHDEAEDFTEVEKYYSSIGDLSKIFNTYPDAALAIIDVMLRIGKYDEIIAFLPPEKTIRKGNVVYARATYYVTMAKYLRDGVVPEEMSKIRNDFPKAREIYYMRHPRKEMIHAL